jgi:alpha-mannosidase
MQTYQLPPSCSIRHCIVSASTHTTVLNTYPIQTVRHIADGRKHKRGQLPKTPFFVDGAPNVILETIKRSDDERFNGKRDSDTSVVIIRLYEALGGHATAELRIAESLQVLKATRTNLLEDDLEVLEITRPGGAQSSTSVTLPFHGFQVVTVKLVVTTSSSIADGE